MNPTRHLSNLGSKTSVKILFVGFLILVMLIPLSSIQSLIHERSMRGAEARHEIESTWGGAQRIAGPFLTVPYEVVGHGKELVEDRSTGAYKTVSVKKKIRKQVRIVPETLDIRASAEPQVRQRGAFETVLYHGKIHFEGAFSKIDTGIFGNSAHRILWEEAYVSLELSQMKGVTNEVRLHWNGRTVGFEPSGEEPQLLASAIVAPLGRKGLEGEAENGAREGAEAAAPGDGGTFSFVVNLAGSRNFEVVPLGRGNRVWLESPWPHPSFHGARLPTKRSVTDKGFNALWEVGSFGRSFPQAWRVGETPKIDQKLNESAFGTRFLMPVDVYVQATRSVKYGALFILLTFLAFFLFEVMNGLRIHPIQYLMVGFGICLFYVLLLSLSEHIPFTAAYGLALAGVVGMIGGYVSKVLHSRKRALGLSGFLAALYAYLFVLLRMEDFALLFGSLGLFGILAGAMYITRNVDWYAVSLPKADAPESITTMIPSPRQEAAVPVEE